MFSKFFNSRNKSYRPSFNPMIKQKSKPIRPTQNSISLNEPTRKSKFITPITKSNRFTRKLKKLRHSRNNLSTLRKTLGYNVTAPIPFMNKVNREIEKVNYSSRLYEKRKEKRKTMKKIKE